MNDKLKTKMILATQTLKSIVEGPTVYLIPKGEGKEEELIKVSINFDRKLKIKSRMSKNKTFLSKFLLHLNYCLIIIIFCREIRCALLAMAFYFIL